MAFIIATKKSGILKDKPNDRCNLAHSEKQFSEYTQRPTQSTENIGQILCFNAPIASYRFHSSP